jgi:hypothetical protein
MRSLLTINVPVVYMARYVMVLRRATSITRGILKGLALEIDTFLDPEMGCPFIGTIAFMFPSYFWAFFSSDCLTVDANWTFVLYVLHRVGDFTWPYQFL